MSNRQVYPSSLFPLRGDVSAESGATSVLVTGIQGIPVISPPTEPASLDTFFYDSYTNEWFYASPWDIPVGRVLEFEGYGYDPVGISWLASDTIAVGDGTQGDVSGAAAMTALILFGSPGYDYAYEQCYTTIYSGAIQNWNLVLPPTAGSAGQVLTTNGSGVTSWITVSGGGTPGGSTGDIQYNNAGSFAGSAATVTAAGSLIIPEGQILAWEGGYYSTAALSAIATDTLGVGNGTAGDVSGGMGMTALILFGSSAYGSAYDLYHTILYSGATENWNLILPETPGTSGQLLTTNGNGFTYWSSVVPPSWSALTAATANLTLSNAAYTTTFNQTSAVPWVWANTTASIAPVVTAPTLGAGSTNANAAASGSLTLSINVGDFVLIFVNTSSATPPVITDNASPNSNFYVQVGTLTQANQGEGYVFMCPAATHSATTVTATTASGSIYSTTGATFLNVTGVGATAVATGSSAAPSASVTTTAANSLVVGALQVGTGHVTGATSGSILANVTTGTTPQAILDLLQATSGTSTTISGTSGNGAWGAFAIELLGTPVVENISSPIVSISGTYWNGASATDAWSIQDVPGAGTNPTSTLQFTHTGSSGTPQVSFPQHSITLNSLPQAGGALYIGNVLAGPIAGSQPIVYAANVVQAYPFRLELGITVNKIAGMCTVAQSGKTFDIGIYNSAGVLLCNIGAQSITSSYPQVFTPTQGAGVYLPPGLYYFAQTATTATGCCNAHSGQFYYMAGSGSQVAGISPMLAVNGVLPPLLGTLVYTQAHLEYPMSAGFLN